MAPLLSKPEVGKDDEIMLKYRISPLSDLRLHIYHAWVGIWLSSKNETALPPPKWTVEELGQFFHDWKLHNLLDIELLKSIVQSFQSHVASGNITLGGDVPPSCAETNILSQAYNPQTECSCNGLYPVPDGMTVDAVLKQTSCSAIAAMLSAQHDVATRQTEWSSRNGAIFTAPKLAAAVNELVLANADAQPAPRSCTNQPIPAITAPDRRPSKETDSDPRLHNTLFPTFEGIKLCADAKHLFAMACGASALDRGLLAAIADSGNDILIGDYADAASPTTLARLQRTGAAATAFLKMCHLAGTLTDWQFNTLAAAIIQFRVLGYHRDHARNRLPPAIHGSRMTGVTVHRHVDIAIFHGVLPASLVTGAQLSEPAYMRLSEACTLINDLVDLRSDAMRRQRENVVLRGFPATTSACAYLDGLLTRLLTAVCGVMAEGKLGALVVMAFCNWAVMASHHKLFELVGGVVPVRGSPACRYKSVEDGALYARLLALLEPFGTLGEWKPDLRRRRAMLDQMYGLARMSADSHVGWLADVTRALLQPAQLRRIVDVVHYEWKGGVGDVEYCP
ncbi:uncharacterized protein ACLA_044140 [Aspergillus clavatus NRRL 1]|uniref:Uncharacterized protein n=1 Tax=Aspergillus clavatus (strain ATCC 1007 / CBS 513.65 / DSM 816 / NCTC 3887 / NRRL 1 / QM 1276 / 107) TaxID=344612 RepID=A1C8Q7_ASPCL|nr:uncharacterized protein ACLA_044140 [Aspergillus clavatus NRRL 1]EAW13694.1 hypothetical protein ACLA_044140 [Aspergillus clavatus NRRL 1]